LPFLHIDKTLSINLITRLMLLMLLMLNDVRVVVRKNWYVIISAKCKIFHNDFNKYE